MADLKSASVSSSKAELTKALKRDKQILEGIQNALQRAVSKSGSGKGSAAAGTSTYGASAGSAGSAKSVSPVVMIDQKYYETITDSDKSEYLTAVREMYKLANQFTSKFGNSTESKLFKSYFEHITGGPIKFTPSDQL